MTPLLKRLESLGYVQRRRPVDDERSVEVSLTEQGARRRAEAEDLPVAGSHAFGLTEQQTATLRDLLRRVTDNTSGYAQRRLAGCAQPEQNAWPGGYGRPGGHPAASNTATGSR